MTDVLERDSATPLYVQLEQILHARIVSGQWAPGQRIPSENELNKMFGLSRMTVRGVLTKLVGDGLLVRVPGKGTYVATPKISAVSPAYRGVREQLESQGYETSTRLVSLDARDPVVGRARAPSAAPTTTRRTSSSASAPCRASRSACTASYVPARLAPGLDDHDVVANQLCVVLEEHYGLPMKRVREDLEAVAVSTAEARHLGMRRGEPALQLHDVIFDALSRAVRVQLDRVPRRPDAAALRLRPLTLLEQAAAHPLADRGDVAVAQLHAGAAAQAHDVVGPRRGEVGGGGLGRELLTAVQRARDDEVDGRAADCGARLLAGVAHAAGRLGAVERVRRQVGGQRREQDPVVGPAQPGGVGDGGDLALQCARVGVGLGDRAGQVGLAEPLRVPDVARRTRRRRDLGHVAGEPLEEPARAAPAGPGQGRVGLLGGAGDRAERDRAVRRADALQDRPAGGLAGDRPRRSRPDGLRLRFGRGPTAGSLPARGGFSVCSAFSLDRPRPLVGAGTGVRGASTFSVEAVLVTSSARSSAVITWSATAR